MNPTTKTNAQIGYKNGKALKDIIPPIYSEFRKLNPLLNDDNFSVKKTRKTIEIFKPYEIFPEWPSDEEVNVYIFIK